MNKEKEKIISAYKQGCSLRAIGKEIGRSHLFVWKILKTFNPDILRSPRSYRKYSFDCRYFRNYSPENSYWMGFIDADGHVDTRRGRVELKLHCRDLDRISAFRNSVNGNFPIYKFKTRPFVGIQVFSRDLVNDLVQKNIGVKSPNLEPPIGILKDHVRHFIRGYFEGDGSISLGHRHNGRLNPIFGILGSRHLLEWMKEKMIEQAGVKSRMKITPRKGCWALKLGSYDSLNRIRQYFYEDVDKSLYMIRKKEKLDRISHVWCK